MVYLRVGRKGEDRKNNPPPPAAGQVGWGVGPTAGWFAFAASQGLVGGAGSTSMDVITYFVSICYLFPDLVE